MKFKAIILSLMLAVCGICFADTAAPAAAAVPAAAQVQSAAPADNAAAAPAKNQKKGSSWQGMLMPILLIVAMIFIFSRSNKKQQQKRQEMLDRIVKGSRVMLNSGVYGKISEVREKEFLVEIAENVKVLVVKNGIASVEDENEKSGDAK